MTYTVKDFVPTRSERLQVMELIAFSMPLDQIAAVIGRDLTENVVSRVFADEIKYGAAYLKSELIRVLVSKAMQGDNASIKRLFESIVPADAESTFLQDTNREIEAAKKAPKLGKKDQAKADAADAVSDTTSGWGDLLGPGIVN